MWPAETNKIYITQEEKEKNCHEELLICSLGNRNSQRTFLINWEINSSRENFK